MEQQGPVMIKIGGSLLKQATVVQLAPLWSVLQEAARTRPLLLTPGGGVFADLVRQQGGQWRLSEPTCHWMALAAMDQMAALLQEQLPGSRARSLAEWPAARPPGAGITILRYAEALRQVPPEQLPQSWQVTSDSIAAWAARRCGCAALLLLKAALLTGAWQADWLDGHFARLLPLPLPTWLLNGRQAADLQQWLAQGSAPGWLIAAGQTRPRRAL